MSSNHVETDHLISLLNRWQGKRILVAGDYMLDRHIFGSADRLSPDAPVPVLAVRDESFAPGGAANVAMDLAALRCEVVCLGVVGRDVAAEKLCSVLQEQGCTTRGLIPSADRPTSIKHNFIGLAQHRLPQKMLRVDEESRVPIPGTVTKRLLAGAARQLAKASVLCIQDHNKGVLTESVCQQLIQLARQHQVPVLVDPAAIDDYRKYRGATCIVPNRFEAALAVGRSELLRQPSEIRAVARRLLRQLHLSAIVVTLDKEGALLLEKGGRPMVVPTQAREVFDVTGAGDMVLSMLAASVANGAAWRPGLELANVAAGLEVEKFGIVPIDLDEVRLALLRQHHRDLGKLRSVDQLVPELEAHRNQGRTIAFTNGCFDILHAGHVSYLRQASQQGDLLVVAVNSDRSIRRIKGHGRPVNGETDRLMVLSELESVDYLVLFDQDTPMDLIKSTRPDILVKGGDYKRSEVVGGDWVTKHGGRVVLVNLVKGRSTTNIIRKIATGPNK